jgi:hypothetical protein
MPEHMLIPTARVFTDPEAWPRQTLDRDRVALFMDLFADGGLHALPPLEVVPIDDGEFLLTDGWHRLEALCELDIDNAPALIAHPGPLDPWAFAYQRGLETCATASRPLSRAERRAATERLLAERPDLTDVAIAQLTGVSNNTVGRARRRLVNDNTKPNDGVESEGEVYQQRADHRDVSRALIRQLDKLWNARPLLMSAGLRDHARLGDTLASELIQAHGHEGALIWAERLQTWADRASVTARAAANRAASSDAP